MIFPTSSDFNKSKAVELKFVDIVFGSIICGAISPTTVSEKQVSWSLNPSARCFDHSHENFLIFNDRYFKAGQSIPAQVRDDCFNMVISLFNLLSSNKSEERNEGLHFFYDKISPSSLFAWLLISNNFFNKGVGSNEPIKLYLSDAFSDLTNQQILESIKSNFNNPAFVFNYNYPDHFISISGSKQLFLQAILK